MLEKNNPGRFTVQFNLSDPSHRRVVDLLNQQGRRKAQFLTNAVSHYLNCPETPTSAQPTSNISIIETIIRRILEEQSSTPKSQAIPCAVSTTVSRGSETIQLSHAEEPLGKDGLGAIVKAMANFRRE